MDTARRGRGGPEAKASVPRAPFPFAFMSGVFAALAAAASLAAGCTHRALCAGAAAEIAFAHEAHAIVAQAAGAVAAVVPWAGAATLVQCDPAAYASDSGSLVMGAAGWAMLCAVVALWALVAAAQYLYVAYVVAGDYIVGPFPLPVMGNVLPLLLDPQFPSNAHRHNMRLLNAHGGRLFRFWRGTFDHMVSCCDADAYRRLLTSRYKVYERDPRDDARFGKFLSGGLIFERNGSEWKRWRQVLAPAFSASRLNALVQPAVACAELLRDRLLRAADDSKSHAGGVDVEEEMLRLTFDMICRSTFGVSFGCQAGDIAPAARHGGHAWRHPGDLPKELRAFNYILGYLQAKYFASWPDWTVIPDALNPWERRFDRELKVLRDSIDEHVVARVASAPELAEHDDGDGASDGDGDGDSDGDSDSRRRRRTSSAGDERDTVWGDDMLATMIKARARSMGSGSAGAPGGASSGPGDAAAHVDAWPSVDAIRTQIMTLLFAGHDTTANMLTWAMFYLARYPEVKALAVEEVMRVTGGEPVRPQHMSKLTYVTAVLKETLRLRPSVPGRTRLLLEDDTDFCGHTLRKGTIVAWASYAMGRSEAYWEAPAKFDPTRFLGGPAGDAQGRGRGDSASSVPSTASAPSDVGGLADRTGNTHPYQYVAFGAGPRRCIGEPLAILEGRVVLATLLSSGLQWSVAPGQSEEDAMALTLKQRDGMRLAVTRGPKPPKPPKPTPRRALGEAVAAGPHGSHGPTITRGHGATGDGDSDGTAEAETNATATATPPSGTRTAAGAPVRRAAPSDTFPDVGPGATVASGHNASILLKWLSAARGNIAARRNVGESKDGGSAGGGGAGAGSDGAAGGGAERYQTQ